VTISSAVCAHASREREATALAARLSAPISWDDGSVGILANHDLALQEAEKWATDWCVVVEDDAIPIPDFRQQADLALDAVVGPLASLYFGYVAKPRRMVSLSLDRLDPHWIMKPGFTSAVCIAVRKDFVAPLLQISSAIDTMTVDQRYSYAAKQLGHEWIPHSNPSLVEHSDIPGIDGACGIPRHAYKVGGRAEWTSKHLRFWERVWD
jgi:hypothetical protein